MLPGRAVLCNFEKSFSCAILDSGLIRGLLAANKKNTSHASVIGRRLLQDTAPAEMAALATLAEVTYYILIWIIVAANSAVC